MPKLHVDEVFTKKSGNPLIINFHNGYTTENFTADKCNVFRNVNNDANSLVVELNDLLYAGDEEEELLGKTLLLARDRNTGQVRVIEVGKATLMPIIKLDHDADLLETSYLELSRKFGSKKQKQKVEQQEKLKVNVQTVTEQMQNATENITQEKLDLSTYNKSDSDDFYVPPIDRTADKAEDVYDMNKILTEEEYDQIYSELEGKDFKSELLPTVKSVFADRTLSERHTVLAVYANSLMKFCLTVVKDMQRKNYVVCPQSSILNNIILKNFTVVTNGKRGRPMQLKDKAICHTVVFLLLANRLKFSLETFCEDLKLTPITASTKVRVTGASVVNVGNKKVVHLKLPLNVKGGFRRKSAKF